jgi:hypothetical protein
MSDEYEAKAMTVTTTARRFFLRYALMVFGLLAALPMLACGQPPNQFFIVQNQVEEAGCIINTAQSPYRSRGHMDVRLIRKDAITGYLAFPLVKNDLPPEEGSVAQQNRIALSSFVVDLETIGPPPARIADLMQNLEASNPEVLHFRQPTSGSVGPGGALTATSVTVITADLARRIRDTGDLKTVPYLQLGARIKVVGRRGTGVIESDPFLFPINVCDGCLVARVESCPFTTPPTNMGNACNIAQDGFVDCCTMGDSFICPPPVAAP